MAQALRQALSEFIARAERQPAAIRPIPASSYAANLHHERVIARCVAGCTTGALIRIP